MGDAKSEISHNLVGIMHVFEIICCDNNHGNKYNNSRVKAIGQIFLKKLLAIIDKF